MNKVVLVAFNGELVCFAHVLLNALDMRSKGFDVKIVIEGTATKLVPELQREDSPFRGLFKEALELDLVDGACKACSAQMKVLDLIERAGLNLLGDMKGHPSIGGYIQEGYSVITF
ncbi:MAG: cytoplasmic protein [Syntrophaceae bacterium]|nr:cytoplasmic protein [Syntrophaceae bacterium]